MSADSCHNQLKVYQMNYEILVNAPVAHFEMSNGAEVSTHSVFALTVPMTVRSEDIVKVNYCDCGCGEKTAIVKMGATAHSGMYMRVFDAKNAMRTIF
jgi:hypothetical protein